MSDRHNRDIGSKKAYKSKYRCGCWHCEEGKTKKRVINDRQVATEDRENKAYERNSVRIIQE